MIAAEVTKDFPERSSEIHRLCNYLDPDLVPSPPVLLYGPSGSGKTSIAISVLDALHTNDPRIPCAKILCSGFANSKQLFRAIYNAATTALFPSNNSEIFTAMNQRIQASGGGVGVGTPSSSSLSFSAMVATSKEEKRLKQSKPRRIYNISDLCHGLSELMELHDDLAEEGHGNLHQKKRHRRRIRLHILLSSLSSADVYEKDLSVTLLNLAEMSSCPFIKVVAVTRFCISVPVCCMPLRFAAYTDVQLQKILIFRGKQELFASAKTDSGVDSSSSSSNGSSSSRVVGDGDNVQTKIKDFASLVQDVLPRLVISTRHLNEIWSAMKIVWQRHLDYMKELQRNTTPQRQQQSLSNIRATEIISLQKRPIMNMCMDGQKDPRLMQFSSMRVDNWIGSLPASTRFLLLAAYIASKNPSQTDHVTMGVGLKGKRRKTFKGHGDNDDEDVETSILAQRGRTDAHKPIPLDRIFSIYFFVVAQSSTTIIDEEYITKPSVVQQSLGFISSSNSSSSGGRSKKARKIVKDYGDSHLFSSLCSLVNMRLLVNGPNWNLSSPSYFCAIDGSLAEDIAKSLSVPLNDILTS